jgi:hypothetical protein
MAMSQTIKTTGDLREFLVGMMTNIQDGLIDVEKAGAIIRAAQQINESFYSEIKTRHFQRQFGAKAHDLGHLPIGDDLVLGEQAAQGSTNTTEGENQ